MTLWWIADELPTIHMWITLYYHIVMMNWLLIQFIILDVFCSWWFLIQFTIRIAGESCGESSGDLPLRHCRPSTNPIPERAENRFPAAPATLHGHAINCVPVHRFRIGRTPETGLTLAEWREFSRYALACILMHAVKTEPARFWRVFGWFVACFTGFPSETPWGRFCGAYKKTLC